MYYFMILIFVWLFMQSMLSFHEMTKVSESPNAEYKLPIITIYIS